MVSNYVKIQYFLFIFAVFVVFCKPVWYNYRRYIKRKLRNRMINLKELITEYPACLESSDKLRSYLKDVYPNEKARINILVSIFACGIAESIKNKRGFSELEKTNYCNRLENEFGYSEKLSQECLMLWARKGG